MSSSAPVKRHNHRNRLGERRGQRDAGSSRDASEEDNDAASDVGSMMSVPERTPSKTQTDDQSIATISPATVRSGPPPPLHLQAALGAAGLSHGHKRGKKDLSGEGSQSEGFDSPMYDGDVESSSTIGGTPVHPTHQHPHQTHHRRPSSPTPHHTATPHASLSPYGGQRLPTPKASHAQLIDDDSPPLYPHTAHATTATLAENAIIPADVPVAVSKSLAQASKSQTSPLSAKSSNANLGPPKMYARPKELPIEDIKAFVQRAIDGEGEVDGVDRWWKTNPAPEDKVVRVYADGIYDLFHFGHALQLRQAKLSFPKVYLMVGVCSDQLCASHKSPPAMTHAERCESVRHCRWVDEVLPDAPWVVDQAWLDRHKIDYIAHDELVYPGAGHDDVYAFAKGQGRFVPTRRTPAISTSELLERIVRGYRDGFFDSKLSKNGHPELLAADVDWDSSTEKRERRERKEREAKAKESDSA